jgi:hypothetical protein
MTQKEALTILKLGHTTFLTGPAGAGKSYVLREYLAYLRAHRIPYAITASTGIAATHVGGQTIHSWSGLGIRNTLSAYDLDHLTEKQPLYKKWNSVKVLIIDEVSMLSSQFLDMLGALAREMRRDSRPFGGLQVIFSGDFFQLPPISKRDEMPALYAFHSQEWKEAKPVICYLTEQHRQEDGELTSILKEIRNQDVTEYTYDLLRERSEVIPERSITKLYTHNVDVDSINQNEFEKISGDERKYSMVTRGSAKNVAMLKNNCLAHEALFLKVGAKVMCIKNDIERRFVNGSLGVVHDFDEEGAPIVELASGKKVTVRADLWRMEEEGKVKAEISQIPLRLAWAVTIHKSQGMTLDEAEIDLSKAFAPGMGYVALSRLKSLEGLYLKGLGNSALLLSDEVREMDDTFQSKSELASSALTKYSEDELVLKQKEFITKCGGSTEEIREERDDIEEKISTFEETKLLLLQKLSLGEIAKKRELTVDTIIGHIEKIVERGEEISFEHLLPKKKEYLKIQEAFKEILAEAGAYKLTPTFEKLKGVYDYHTLRLVRAEMRKMAE